MGRNLLKLTVLPLSRVRVPARLLFPRLQRYYHRRLSPSSIRKQLNLVINCYIIKVQGKPATDQFTRSVSDFTPQSLIELGARTGGLIEYSSKSGGFMTRNDN